MYQMAKHVGAGAHSRATPHPKPFFVLCNLSCDMFSPDCTNAACGSTTVIHSCCDRATSLQTFRGSSINTVQSQGPAAQYFRASQCLTLMQPVRVNARLARPARPPIWTYPVRHGRKATPGSTMPSRSILPHCSTGYKPEISTSSSQGRLEESEQIAGKLICRHNQDCEGWSCGGYHALRTLCNIVRRCFNIRASILRARVLRSLYNST